MPRVLENNRQHRAQVQEDHHIRIRLSIIQQRPIMQETSLTRRVEKPLPLQAEFNELTEEL